MREEVEGSTRTYSKQKKSRPLSVSNPLFLDEQSVCKLENHVALRVTITVR